MQRINSALMKSIKKLFLKVTRLSRICEALKRGSLVGRRVNSYPGDDARLSGRLTRDSP